MTYRQQLTTADEALAYAKAHPNARFMDKHGGIVKISTGHNPPYTVPTTNC